MKLAHPLLMLAAIALACWVVWEGWHGSSSPRVRRIAALGLVILVWTGFALGRFASRADVEIAASSGWHVTLGIVANVLITASFLAMFLRRMRVLEIAAGASFLAVALIHQVPSGLSLLRMILER